MPLAKAPRKTPLPCMITPILGPLWVFKLWPVMESSLVQLHVLNWELAALACVDMGRNV